MLKQCLKLSVILVFLCAFSLYGCSGGGGSSDGGESGDREAPSTPTGVSATAMSGERIDLSWNASTDNVGVTLYTISRQDGQTYTTTEISYSNTGLYAGIVYRYTVTASDAAGNRSDASSEVSARTLSDDSDTEAPGVPANVTATAISTSRIDLSWNASTDNVGVTLYTITRHDGQVYTTTSTTYSNTGLNAGTLYRYTVTASDAAGNTSGSSSEASATTQSDVSDTEAPTTPGNLSATAISPTRIDLSWDAATDNVGVTLYTITRTTDNQTFTTTSTSYSDTGLSGGTLYTYTVTAEDAAGNSSDASVEASATTVSGTETTLSITADNSIVDNSDERAINMGGVTSIRLKTYQHHLVLDADTSAISGEKVVSAILRYAQNAHTLEHVTLSSIQGAWVEGSSGGFNTQKGSSCFLAAEYHDDDDTDTLVPWSFPGSRFVDVVYGNGHSLMGYSDCPIVNDYYEWTVPADIVNAIAVGASYGIAVFESSHRVDINPTVYSIESGNKPELVVVTTAGDSAPAAVNSLSATTSGVDRGQAKLSWTIPENAFAYHLAIQGGAYTTQTNVPRYLIPFAGTAGETQTLVLKDILAPGVDYTVSVTAIARGGAQSPAQTVAFTASTIDDYPFTSRQINAPVSSGSGFSQDGLEVFAIPATDKILPTGELVEDVSGNYTVQNAVFDGATVSLRGGRNDLLAFQFVLKDSGSAISNIDINVSLTGLTAEFDRVGFIDTDDGMIAELLRGPSTTYGTRMDENASTEQAQAVLVEIFVPQNATPGTQNGTIDITGSFGSGSISIPISIQIDDFIVPDKPTFKCEMNDYGYPNYLATYNTLQTTARRFRSHVNLVPYGHSGRTRMDMVLLDDEQMNETQYNAIDAGDTEGNWDDFVTGFDPVFNADLYSGEPWASSPIPGYYLTFYESWPLLARDYYNEGTKDAFDAFPSIYGETFKAILTDFVNLANTNSWNEAGFQVYLNNKPRSDYYTIPSNGSTPWTLDEPVNFWDFKALGYYGQLFKEGKEAAANHSQIDLKYRIDVSRYPYHRGQLDGLVDLAVVNRDLYLYKRLIFDIAEKDSVEIWNYGTANQIPHSNISAPGWILSCYAMGATGVLPWSTVKEGTDYLSGVTGNDYQQRALFVIAEDSQTPELYPSLRLAAYRQGALDAEYLTILKEQGNYTTGQIERLINHYLDLGTAFSISGDYTEDAGTISFDDLTSTQLWQLRMHVLDSIAELGL